MLGGEPARKGVRDLLSHLPEVEGAPVRSEDLVGARRDEVECRLEVLLGVDALGDGLEGLEVGEGALGRLVELGVAHHHGGLRGQGADDPFLILGEVVWNGLRERDRPHRLDPGEQRGDEHGAHMVGVKDRVAPSRPPRIQLVIGDPLRAAVGQHPAEHTPLELFGRGLEQVRIDPLRFGQGDLVPAVGSVEGDPQPVRFRDARHLVGKEVEHLPEIEGLEQIGHRGVQIRELMELLPSGGVEQRDEAHGQDRGEQVPDRAHRLGVVEQHRGREAERPEDDRRGELPHRSGDQHRPKRLLAKRREEGGDLQRRRGRIDGEQGEHGDEKGFLVDQEGGTTGCRHPPYQRGPCGAREQDRQDAVPHVEEHRRDWPAAQELIADHRTRRGRPGGGDRPEEHDRGQRHRRTEGEVPTARDGDLNMLRRGGKRGDDEQHGDGRERAPPPQRGDGRGPSDRGAPGDEPGHDRPTRSHSVGLEGWGDDSGARQPRIYTTNTPGKVGIRP